MALLRPCKTTAAYEAIPEHELLLEMPDVQKGLEARGWEVLADAGTMLVVRRGADDATVFRSGKLLIKTRDAAVAERIWSELKFLLPPSEAVHGS